MNTKIKCLLLDDETLGLTYLKMLCEQIPELEIVKVYNNPEKLLQEINGLHVDLCIMDIEMPEMNGITLANLLSEKHIIFVTAYKEFAVDAFELNAVDYITKPVKKERLERAVLKVRERMEKESAKHFIVLPTNKGKTMVPFESILYIRPSEQDSRDKEVFLEDGERIWVKNMSYDKLLEQLPKNRFCRINKSEVLAMKCVQHFTQEEVTSSLILEGDKPLKLVIGQAYKEDFLHRF